MTFFLVSRVVILIVAMASMEVFMRLRSTEIRRGTYIAGTLAIYGLVVFCIKLVF